MRDEVGAFVRQTLAFLPARPSPPNPPFLFLKLEALIYQESHATSEAFCLQS